jgi:hypothetical protein
LVGRRGDAIKLYKIRKADILRGVKMPANMKDKGIKLSVLAQEAIDWLVNHDRMWRASDQFESSSAFG